MKKQIVIRSLGPSVNSCAFYFGSIIDGQFVADDLQSDDCLFDEFFEDFIVNTSSAATCHLSSVVRVDYMIGPGNYICRDEVFPFVYSVMTGIPTVKVQYLDQMIILEFDVPEENEKDENA